MEQWIESIYSDGTEYFVSNPEPALGETVTVRLRLAELAPVEHIFLRSEPNGVEQLAEMTWEKTEHGLAYYTAPLTMTQQRMQYRFYLCTPDSLLFYNQNGVTETIPDRNYDFRLLTDYRQPAWVKEAVFYQIFPERFCNGDPSNDVRDGEYTMDGHPTIRREWNQPPLPYEEGFCMDFFGGDLEGIRQKIPYLKKLGVTALYLNPIFQAPSAHKYDCIDYFHVDPHFGGDEALARLTEELHRNDMKLVLDISINHTGIGHRWFNRDALYFDKSEGAYNNPDSREREYYFFQPGTNQYKGWDNVDTLPVLNYTSEALRQVVYQAEDSVIKKWLKPPYNIDGWRFDVADVFARNNEIQLADEVWPQLCASIRAENPQAYILAEDWGDCAARLQGDDYDAPMNYFGCCRIVREFFGGTDLYLRRNPILNSLPYRIGARQLKTRVTGFLAKLPYVLAQNQFNLLNSHDIPRIQQMPHMSREATRGAAILMFLLPGAPNIYYGDEAEIGGWVETNEGFRYPMPWDKDIEATQSYQLYHRLIQLKKSSPALSHGGMKFLYAEGSVAALARFDEQEVFVGVVSADKQPQTVRLPLWQVGAAAPAADIDLLDTPLECTVEGREAVLTLQPEQAVLFRCKMI